MAGPDGSRIRRLGRKSVPLGLVAAYAILVTGSGFDRIAAQRPSLAQWVPAAFAAEVRETEARGFVEAGLAGPAESPARAAMIASPVDPGPLALFGLARLARGDARQADRAFRLSARLGWREPLTQSFWFESALSGGDMQNAVLRFDALARQFPRSAAVTAAASRLEATPAGRAALAGRIAAGANWVADYATLDGRTPVDRMRSRATVLLAATRLGHQIGCQDSVGLVRVLASHDPASSAALWQASCNEAGVPGTIADADFERLQPLQTRVPFEWELAGHGDIETALIDAANGGKQLELHSSAPGTLPVLAQLVVLEPGRYRLDWDAKPAGTVRVSLSCRRSVMATSATGAGNSAELEVDGTCPARWLQFWLAPASGKVTLDRVRLTRY